RRLRIPLLAPHGIRVEDRPDGPAAIQLLALRVWIVPAETRVEEIVRVVQLVPETLAELVDADEILIALDRQARAADLREHRAARTPSQVLVSVARADVARLRHRAAMLARDVRRAPQRRAHRHRQHLAVGVLSAPRFACDLILLGQPRSEHPAERDVAREAAGGDGGAAPGLGI